MSPAKKASCGACANLKARCGECTQRALTRENAALRKGMKRALKALESYGLGRINKAQLELLAALEVADEVAHD